MTELAYMRRYYRRKQRCATLWKSLAISQQNRRQHSLTLLKLQMDDTRKSCSTESEGTGEEKHFIFICTGLANTQSALIIPEGAHVISVPKRHLVGSTALSGQGELCTEGPAAELTCRTMGSCSGGLRFSTPIVSHTWNAVSCSAKKGLCC